MAECLNELLSLLCRFDDRSLFHGRKGRYLTHLLIILYSRCNYKNISLTPVTNLMETVSCMSVTCSKEASSSSGSTSKTPLLRKEEILAPLNTCVYAPRYTPERERERHTHTTCLCMYITIMG